MKYLLVYEEKIQNNTTYCNNIPVTLTHSTSQTYSNWPGLAESGTWHTLTQEFTTFADVEKFIDSKCTSLHSENKVYKQFWNFRPVKIYEVNKVFDVKSVDVVTKEIQEIEHKQQDGYEIKEVGR